MASPYARGKYALGICDVCSFRYKLSELRYTYVQGKNTHIKACPKCWDPDHPQNFLPQAVQTHGSDPEQLHDPRPDVFPTAYPVKLSPATMAHGDVATVMATGVFSGYSVSAAASDPGITVSNPVLLGPTKAMLTISVSGSLAAGKYTITITDGSGASLKALLTTT